MEVELISRVAFTFKEARSESRFQLRWIDFSHIQCGVLLDGTGEYRAHVDTEIGN
jgi:hypothetical protein